MILDFETTAIYNGVASAAAFALSMIIFYWFWLRRD